MYIHLTTPIQIYLIFLIILFQLIKRYFLIFEDEKINTHIYKHTMHFIMYYIFIE